MQPVIVKAVSEMHNNVLRNNTPVLTRIDVSDIVSDQCRSE